MTNPTELFANNFQTTLATGIGAAATSATITDSLPSSLQASGEFRLLLGTNKSGELVLASMGVGATVLTLTRGVEGSASEEWQAGTPVQQVLTAGGLNDTVQAAVVNMVTAPQLRAAAGYDPSGAASSDAALQTTLNAAAAFASPQVVIPAGDTLKLTTGGITIPAGVELVIDGTLNGSAAPTAGTLLTAAGTVAAAQTLLANCPQGQNFCQVTGASPADNTYIKLQSNALWNAGLTLNFPNSGNQRYGEMMLVRVPTATVGTAITAGDTTITLNNTQGDARTSYFPIGAPVTIGADTITFTGVSPASTTITLTGCTGVSNNHSIGVAVTLAAGYVAFAGPCVGGPYNTADTAQIVPTTFCNAPAVTGSGTLLGGGSATGQWGIIFNTCRSPRLGDNLKLVNVADTGVYFEDCIDVMAAGPTVYGGRSVSSDFYGLLFAGAGQDVTIKGGIFRDVRHGVSGGNVPVYGITRRVTVDGAHAMNTTATSFESHCGSDDWAYINCYSTDSLDNGISFRCPSGRVENFLCRRPATRGIWLRNQTTQPSRYVVTGFDIEDTGSGGIALRPDTGFFANLQSTISSGTAAPFTITVDTTFQPNGFPSGGGSIIVGETSGTGAEQMVYDSCTATTFHVTARAQNGTTAQTFASGPIMLGSTGTGATTDSVEISNGKILRAQGDSSISVYTADNLRFQGIKISNVTIKDQVYGGAAVQITNADHCDIDVTVLGHPATRKMVQLINCTHCTVRLNGKFASLSTGIGVSFESGSNKCIAISPVLENAATGVIADSTCTNCGVIDTVGLNGIATPISFPTGAGHLVDVPSGYQKLTANGTFAVPAGVTTLRVRAIGGGAGGGGGGSAAATQLQVGGGGGSGGTVIDQGFTVAPGNVITIAVGAGSAGGAGGAAGGTLGSDGNGGGTTTVTNTTTSTTLIQAFGGSKGRGSALSSTVVVGGGLYGINGVTTATQASLWAGSGGCSAVPSPFPALTVVGGAGGGTATATLGGGGGNAQLSSAVIAGQSVGAQSGTAAGVVGVTATQPGCGGGGGGGGAAGTGAGGTGGAGASGQAEIWW